MQLSPLKLKRLCELVVLDMSKNLDPNYFKGSRLVDLFNKCGFGDVYDYNSPKVPFRLQDKYEPKSRTDYATHNLRVLNDRNQIEIIKEALIFYAGDEKKMREEFDEIFNEQVADKLQDTKVKVEPLVEPAPYHLSPTWPFTSNDDHKRVFLSYSHDNEEHQIWCLKLCNDLRYLGIDAVIDTSMQKGLSLIDFMDKGIANAHNVLIIGTPNYKLKSEKNSGGVKYEDSIIKSSLFFEINKGKYIPVLRKGDFLTSFPSSISLLNGYNMTDDSAYSKVLEEIRHEIYDKPFKPLASLADVPEFAISSSNQNDWEEKMDEFVKKSQSYQPIPKEEKDIQIIPNEKKQVQPYLPVYRTNNFTDSFKNKDYLESYIHKIYEKLYQFAKSQVEIETIRLGDSDKKQIVPESSLISDIFADGYKVIRSTNKLLSQKYVGEEYLAEARVIEAFTYYNMAMLWGNIPIVKSTNLSEFLETPQSGSEVAYRYCLELLQKCSSIKSLDNRHVTNSFINILYTELYLSLGQKDLAYSHLNKVSSFNNSIFTLNVADKNENKSIIDIYTQKYVELLKEEIGGEDNSKVWFERGPVYGTWAALKRLGKAQLLTGIKEYELLLPIPLTETCSNIHVKQNPGY